MPLNKFRYEDGRSPNWYLRGSVRGIAVLESTGTHDEDAAEQIRIKRESDLLEESIHGKRSTTTFLAAAVKYMERGGSPRYLGTLDEATGQWDGLIGRFALRRLSTIDQDDLDTAASEMYPDASPATRNRNVYTPFVAVWNDAAGDKKCEERKWKRPRKPKGTRQASAPARVGTTAVPLERAADFVLAMSPAAAINMSILFFTGMRPIELYCLDADKVNIEGRWLTTDSKTGEPRGIPIHEGLVPLLTALVARGGPIARTHKGLPYEPRDDAGGQMKSAIDGARKRSGIRDIAPYTARHTFSTELVIQGVHPHVKDEILGHAVTTMSRRYTHVPQAPLIEAVNKVAMPERWRTAPFMLDPLAQNRLLKLRPETIEKIRARALGGNRKGVTWSADAKKKVSEGMRAYWARKREQMKNA